MFSNLRSGHFLFVDHNCQQHLGKVDHYTGMHPTTFRYFRCLVIYAKVAKRPFTFRNSIFDFCSWYAVLLKVNREGFFRWRRKVHIETNHKSFFVINRVHLIQVTSKLLNIEMLIYAFFFL